MTDNNIIKALECCAEQKCWECPNEPKENKKGTFGCSWEMMLATLDLINHQKAEIERLKYNLKAVLEERADHSEAITEFAEIFTEKMITLFHLEYSQAESIRRTARQIAKEMKEGVEQ